MKNLKNLVKHLRKNMQEPEKILWARLRDRRFKNYKFRRQVQISKYIVDFVCLEKQLIIEVDGKYHDTEYQRGYDEQRTQILNNLGFRVLRFFNEEVLCTPENVLHTIQNALY
jgi:very-short-patch-repair endonuclease